ncbi:hypothetical protein AB0G86_40490 [Streptomyces scabiei]|uniref:hypothetical protein n=1 Tax=Streptomyces scabiei TaxID=1930 RepID=UPI0033F619EC
MNSTLVAGVAQSSTADGAGIVRWNSVDLDDRPWKIVRVNRPHPSPHRPPGPPT